MKYVLIAGILVASLFTAGVVGLMTPVGHDFADNFNENNHYHNEDCEEHHHFYEFGHHNGHHHHDEHEDCYEEENSK